MKAEDLYYYDLPLQNHFNLQYVAKVYLGSPLQEVNAIWDTGSSRFLVETQDCENCHGQVFDYSKSRTFRFSFDDLMDEDNTVEVSYGDGTKLIGSYATDRVCPTL